MEPFYTGTTWLFAGNFASLNFIFGNPSAITASQNKTLHTMRGTAIDGGV